MRGRGLAIGAGLLTAAGCAPYSALHPAGEQAQRLTMLGWGLIGLMSAIILVMGGLLLWSIRRRRRGSLDAHLPIDADGGKGWILIGGVAIPAVVLSALFAITLGTLSAFPGEPPEPDLEVKITAHQWWWEVEYQYPDLSERFVTANEIHIPVGTPVAFTLESADVIHSFWVPRLHGKLDLIPGHKNRMVVQADQAGTYRGECAEYCGVQHTNMRFSVVADPPQRFQEWVQTQRQPAETPKTDRLARGKQAFEEYACAMCHRVRGTRAQGTVAPDLTHFGSRHSIAGVMPNTRARLQAWIVDAQAFKPGSRMPTLEQFDGRTLNNLAAYLESLK